MQFWQSVILAIVEGFTEYLPVSSTGHIIVASSLMGINSLEFTKDFTVIVQFGAILSVLVLYWRKFFKDFNQDKISFYLKLFVAFLPAAILGLALSKIIDRALGSVQTVAISFIIGGVVLLFVDRVFRKNTATSSELSEPPNLSYIDSIVIGLFQCLALCPGVSRSAATIIGGLQRKMSRKDAAEFSFFLAVPTLTAATLYKVAKIYKHIEPHQVSILLVGNLVSFFVGMLTIRIFIQYLTRHGFKVFGIYRILLGVIILLLLYFGHDMQFV